MAFGQKARVPLSGVWLDPLTENEVVRHVRSALDRGDGGWLITPNVDILRLAEADPTVHGYLEAASLVVADGMPLVWACRIAGTPVPHRVTGAGLIWSLSAALAPDGRSVYVVGGEPGECSGAQRAATALATRYPGLRIAGHAAPSHGFDRRPRELAGVCADVIEAKPDMVFAGLGFPKQERLIARLRPELPGTWFLGCGAAVNFAAGDDRRAPQWMQRTGLEWLHRLVREPRRLAGRYLGHDAPYALRLLHRAARHRVRGHGAGW